jgi:oligopeptidase A
VSYSWGIVGHLMGVKNSPDLREAHENVQTKVISAYQELGQSQPIFKALNTLKTNSNIWATLDGAQKRIVDKSLQDMHNSGVGLPNDKREIFNKLQSEAATLSSKFNNNVLDSTKEFTLKLTSKKQIDGIPDSALSSFAAKAKSLGDENATASDGPWVVGLDHVAYLPIMQHCKDSSIREQLYRAFTSRANTGDLDNAPIIKRILQIKKEMASMLGYNSHAEKSIASKMAPSVEAVEDLTEMLYEVAYPAAQKELKDVQNFANSKGYNGELQLWDVAYWSERQREELYEYSEEELKPYFPLPNVLNGLFQLAHRLFNIRIEAADGQTEVWNDDVRFFNIYDSNSNNHIASFYLDAYSRPSNKRGGAWMDVCIGKSKVMNRIPVAYLTCNGSPPIGTKPSLMTFREVETLFHEFGHGLQHMLTTVEHGDAAGINNVEWDAVELPSQFMENWCYDKPTLYSFAKHYETGEPLPVDLYNKVNSAKTYQAGLQMIRQLYFGSMDMYIHSDKFDPNGILSVFDVQHALAKKFTVIPPLETDRFLCSFGHIFGGGYSAGYYSYKYAEVMSADAFSAFEEAGLDNEEAVKEIGKRFRDTVLSLGGGTHPGEVFRTFRGRDPSPEALLRHSGLTKTEE